MVTSMDGWWGNLRASRFSKFVGQALRLPSFINVAGDAPALQCGNTFGSRM